MFGDINKIYLMGNVTRDPELRYTPNGSAVISFSLATNRRYKKGDEWTDEVSFHNIVCWNSAEGLSQRIKKGTRVHIEGRLQSRSWDDKEGKKQYKTEVICERIILIARYEGERTEGGTSNFSPKGKSTAPAGEDDSMPEDSSSTEDSIDPNDLPF